MQKLSLCTGSPEQYVVPLRLELSMWNKLHTQSSNVQRLDSVRGKIKRTFQLHSNMETLLKSAERASFSFTLINVALLIFHTDVCLIVLHSSFEKSLQTKKRQCEGGGCVAALVSPSSFCSAGTELSPAQKCIRVNFKVPYSFHR